MVIVTTQINGPAQQTFQTGPWLPDDYATHSPDTDLAGNAGKNDHHRAMWRLSRYGCSAKIASEGSDCSAGS